MESKYLKKNFLLSFFISRQDDCAAVLELNGHYERLKTRKNSWRPSGFVAPAVLQRSGEQTDRNKLFGTFLSYHLTL